jgi:hypothetical protein
MLFWLGLATGPHLVRDSGFILEQHGYAKDHSYKGFLEVYRGGTGKKLIAVSNAVSERVPPRAVVFGFEPRITSYLSGRNVFSPAEALKGLRQRQWPPALHKWRVSWVFYDKAATKRERNVLFSKLFRTRALVPVSGSETTIHNVVVARVTISNALVRLKPATRPATNATTRPAATRNSTH